MSRDMEALAARDTRLPWQIEQGRKCSCKGTDEFCPCQNVERYYRGWRISFVFPPIPIRSFDWSATHPDYDGADGGCGRLVYSATRAGVCAEVDAWINESETDQEPAK